MQGTYIDDKGDVWPEWLPEFRKSIGTNRRIDEVRSVLEETMGFVYTRNTQRGLVIRLHLEKVTVAAIVAVLFFVLDSAEKTLLVSVSINDRWKHDIVRGRNAVDYFQQLLDQRTKCLVNEANRLLSRPIEIIGQTLTRCDAARAILQNMPTLDAMVAVADALFEGRYTIAEQSADHRRITIRRMGIGYRRFDPAWYERAVGQSMDDYPDTSYGKWVSRAYEFAFASERPQFEDVDAYVQWPRNPAARSLYKRLVVPFQRSDGRRLILATTTSDAGIDLRI